MSDIQTMPASPLPRPPGRWKIILGRTFIPVLLVGAFIGMNPRLLSGEGLIIGALVGVWIASLYWTQARQTLPNFFGRKGVDVIMHLLMLAPLLVLTAQWFDDQRMFNRYPLKAWSIILAAFAVVAAFSFLAAYLLRKRSRMRQVVFLLYVGSIIATFYYMVVHNTFYMGSLWFLVAVSWGAALLLGGAGWWLQHRKKAHVQSFMSAAPRLLTYLLMVSATASLFTQMTIRFLMYGTIDENGLPCLGCGMG